MFVNDQLKLISIERRRKSLILRVHPEFFSQVIKRSLRRILRGRIGRYSYSLAYVLNQTTGHKAVLMMIAGLGLGLGMSYVIFQRPSLTTAVPLTEVHEVTGPAIKELRLPDKEVKISVNQEVNHTPFTSARVVSHVPGSARPTEPGVIILADPQGWLEKNLSTAQLGQTIQVVGDNNGIYSYTIIQVRNTTQDDLQQFVIDPTETLILYSRYSWFNNDVIAVIARPTP
jgi:hypothetical protein